MCSSFLVTPCPHATLSVVFSTLAEYPRLAGCCSWLGVPSWYLVHLFGSVGGVRFFLLAGGGYARWPVYSRQAWRVCGHYLWWKYVAWQNMVSRSAVGLGTPWGWGIPLHRHYVAPYEHCPYLGLYTLSPLDTPCLLDCCSAVYTSPFGCAAQIRLSFGRCLVRCSSLSPVPGTIFAWLQRPSFFPVSALLAAAYGGLWRCQSFCAIILSCGAHSAVELLPDGRGLCTFHCIQSVAGVGVLITLGPLEGPFSPRLSGCSLCWLGWGLTS